MDLEELEPRKTQPKKKNLEVMSLADLEEYITELEAEIERARREIAGKRDHRSSADAFFKN